VKGRAVRESTMKGEVKLRRLIVSFMDIKEWNAYNLETLHNSEYPYHGPIFQVPQVDPKYQVQLFISSFPHNLGVDSLPGTASVGPSSLSIHL